MNRTGLAVLRVHPAEVPNPLQWIANFIYNTYVASCPRSRRAVRPTAPCAQGLHDDPPTPTLHKHLSNAAEHESGRLTTAASDQTRDALLSAGLVKRVGDEEFAITTAGRRAPNATWQTTRRLALWHLVEYRDAAGVAQPDDGDTGAGRPPRHPYATELGRSVARTLRPRAR